jgi:hypothetical protein
MDLLADRQDQCIAADLLQGFVDMGYTLYALGVSAHPRAPKQWRSAISQRPLDNLVSNCHWYFNLEEQFPSEEYKMGYWSDILGKQALSSSRGQFSVTVATHSHPLLFLFLSAVAPNVQLGKPTTATGKALTP